MLNNQILRIRFFDWGGQKAGTLQSMCSLQFAATLVLLDAPQTDRNCVELICSMQEEQKQRVRGWGEGGQKSAMDEITNREGSTESLTRQKPELEVARCRGCPATVVRHYQSRCTDIGMR